MTDIDWSGCPIVQRNPRKLGGVPTVRAWRMPADSVVENHDYGASDQEIAEWYNLPLGHFPRKERHGHRICLRIAAVRVELVGGQGRAHRPVLRRTASAVCLFRPLDRSPRRVRARHQAVHRVSVRAVLRRKAVPKTRTGLLTSSCSAKFSFMRRLGHEKVANKRGYTVFAFHRHA